MDFISRVVKAACDELKTVTEKKLTKEMLAEIARILLGFANSLKVLELT